MTKADQKNSRFEVSRGQKPQFHADPAVDDLMNMVVALTAEVSVLRERVDTHERVSEAAGGFGADDVEHYEADPDSQATRAALRADLVDKVFGAALAPVGDPDTEAYDGILAEIETDD